MKIAMILSYGLKTSIKKFKDLPFPRNRIESVDYIIQNGERVESPIEMYKLDEQLYEIVDVDTTRPWRIASYGNHEYIEYLDYKIIDKELNFCELKQ